MDSRNIAYDLAIIEAAQKITSKKSGLYYQFSLLRPFQTSNKQIWDDLEDATGENLRNYSQMNEKGHYLVRTYDDQTFFVKNDVDGFNCWGDKDDYCHCFDCLEVHPSEIASVHKLDDIGKKDCVASVATMNKLNRSHCATVSGDDGDSFLENLVEPFVIKNEEEEDLY